MASLLLPLTAHAGTYSLPGFSGGQWFSSSWEPGTAHLYEGSGNTTGTGDSSMQINSYGAVSATFTWSSPHPLTDPAPPCILTQISYANWNGQFPSQPTASCGDGLGDPEVDSSNGQNYQGNSSGTRYSVGVPNASGVISVNLTGAQSNINPSGNVGVFGSTVLWTVNASPVTINLGGTTPDSNGALNILFGQGCTASLNSLPTGFSLVKCVWSVTGITFQSWTVTQNLSAKPPTSSTNFMPGSGTLTNLTAHWYWNDPDPNSGFIAGTETVKCIATIKPPAGANFTVTANQKVIVQVPGWTATGTGGYMQVNSAAPNESDAICLYAGASGGQSGGMNWFVTVSTSSPFPVGTVELVQLVTPNLSYITRPIPGVQRNDPENGMLGLDTVYPYGWVLLRPYEANDSPAIPLTSGIESAVMQHQFNDYLMFQPPGADVQWVPRATFGWNTNGTAVIPNTGDWADYVAQYGSDNAGAVNPTATTSFIPGSAFPSWTRINVFPNF